MSAEKIGYKQVTQAAEVQVKTGPAGFFGLTVVASTSASVTVYDNTSAAGTVLFTKSSLAVGEVIHFVGNAYAANNGLHVVVGGTGTVNIHYT